MSKNTLASTRTQDTAAGAVMSFAHRTALAAALAAALVAAFFTPLNVSTPQAHTIAPIATHATLAVIARGGCGGTPLPC